VSGQGEQLASGCEDEPPAIAPEGQPKQPSECEQRRDRNRPPHLTDRQMVNRRRGEVQEPKQRTRHSFWTPTPHDESGDDDPGEGQEGRNDHVFRISGRIRRRMT
jgi:hypothetical protein